MVSFQKKNFLKDQIYYFSTQRKLPLKFKHSCLTRIYVTISMKILFTVVIKPLFRKIEDSWPND